MQLNVRQREIAIQLTELRTVTMETLVSQYNVSKRTIYSDLSIIREWLSYHKIQFEDSSIPYIERDEAVKISSILYEVNPYMINHSQRTRINISLALLLFSKEEIYLNDVIKTLGVSRSTFYRDLELLNSWFNQFDLTLDITKDNGVKIFGNEDNYRNAMVSFISKSMMQIDVLSLLHKRNKEGIIFDFEQDFIYRTLEDYIELPVLMKVLDHVNNLEVIEEIELSVNHKNNYTWYIIFSIMRNLDGENITVGNVNESLEEFKFLKEVFFEFELSEEELSYLSDHLLHILDISRTKLKDDNGTNQKLVKFINILSTEMKFPFMQDEKLILSLKKHIYATNERIRRHIVDSNPLKDDITARFHDLYEKVEMALNQTKLIGNNPTDDEIAYIVMYLATIMNKSEEMLRVSVVCTTGKGSAILLMSNLKNTYPNIDIIGLTDVNEAMKMSLKDVDFIVSTTQFYHAEIPIITVTPLLSETDIIKINDNLKLTSEKAVVNENPFGDKGFFNYMNLMTDCINAIKELEQVKRVLTVDEHMAILIHLMIQLTQSNESSAINVKKDNKEVVLILSKLYRKYEKSISDYDLKSIELYFGEKHEG